MKRFLLIITILVSGLTIFAQDIIVTKYEKRIDAKVLEINIDNVRYKDFDNLDGPIYTILKSDIASIVYQNGKVETFSNHPPQPVEQSNVPQNPQNLTANQFDDMNDDDIYAYLRDYEGGKIYETFHSGVKLRSVGKKMLTAGLVSSGVGLTTMIIGIIIMDYNGVSLHSYGYGYRSDYYYPLTADIFYWTGIVFLSIGQGLTIASIPINAVGGSKKRIAKNQYIDQYINGGKTTYTPTLDFNYTGNGLGLVLKF
jgi:hypothetical protein